MILCIVLKITLTIKHASLPNSFIIQNLLYCKNLGNFTCKTLFSAELLMPVLRICFKFDWNNYKTGFKANPRYYFTCKTPFTAVIFIPLHDTRFALKLINLRKKKHIFLQSSQYYFTCNSSPHCRTLTVSSWYRFCCNVRLKNNKTWFIAKFLVLLYLKNTFHCWIFASAWYRICFKCDWNNHKTVFKAKSLVWIYL